MFKGKSFIAVIPARGGSKRLPRKNILDLHGKPLVSWSIDASLKSKYIDRVVVSSDDEELLDISAQFGADILKRPDDLATDTASTFDAIKHVLDNVVHYDYVVLLQPTSPLRTCSHIDEAIEELFKKKAMAVVSVCEMEHSPLWSNTIGADGSLSGFLRDDVKNMRSQELPSYYRLNGAIYICDTQKLLEQKTFFINNDIFAYIMDRESSVDIDTMHDFKLADLLLSAR